MDRSSRDNAAIRGFFLLALLGNLCAVSIGWSHALSDAHGWTQAETAIRAWAIGQGGSWLDYETPVLGAPFAMPQELPVFHLLVALLSAASGSALEPAGRAVSVGFFYASLGVAYGLLAELGVSARHRLLVLALWLLSPLHVFWSRTVSVESTALFFSLAFLLFSVRFLLGHRRWWDTPGALLAGSVAFAVKPTTMVTFAALAFLGWIVAQRRSGYRPTPAMIAGALVVLVPVAVGWTWHGHADALKSRNPLAWALSSDAFVRDWVLGPAGLRAEPGTRTVLWERNIPESAGHVVVLVAAGLGVLIARRRRALFTLAVLVPIAHFAAFTPLHLGHAYEQYGAGLFFPVATGLAAAALLEAGGWRRPLAWALVALAAVSCVGTWRESMLPLQRRDAHRRPAWFVRLASTLAESTQPDEMLLGFGLSANPEVPYYARRRALMWPDWADPSPDGDDVEVALEGLQGQRVGALFSCQPGVAEATLARFRERAGLDPSPARELPSGGTGRCVVYLRPAVGRTPEGTGRPAEGQEQ